MDWMTDLNYQDKINMEKAIIILGEEFVRHFIEKDPNAVHTFHLPEPYRSMSLEEIQHLKKHGLL